MAITNLVNEGVTSDDVSYTSVLFSPSVDNVLLVAYVAVPDATAGQSLISSVPGQTFSKINNAVFDSSTNNIVVFVSNFFAQAQSQTVTFRTQLATGAFICVRQVTGMRKTGPSSVRQMAILENQPAATPAISFPAACLSANPTWLILGNLTNPALAGSSQPVNWTLNTSNGIGAPVTGCHDCSRTSGFSGTTATYQLSSATEFGLIAIEFDTSAPPNPSDMTFLPLGHGGKW